MSQVVTTPELTAAIALIQSNGGNVHFPRQNVVVWGQEFRSIRAVSKDPRCKVSYQTLFNRVKNGIPLETATNVSVYPGASKSVTCWGQTFASLQELALDPRCNVCYSLIGQKLAKGMTPEDAVKDLRTKAPITTIEQAIVGG